MNMINEEGSIQTLLAVIAEKVSSLERRLTAAILEVEKDREKDREERSELSKRMNSVEQMQAMFRGAILVISFVLGSILVPIAVVIATHFLG